jgi:hypothetical protein
MEEDVAYEQLATPSERKRWARQNNLMYGGLIAIGVVILQGFLSATSLGASGRISVVAFAVALPLLAVQLLLGELHATDHTVKSTTTDGIMKAVALAGSLTGVVAAFWHIDWLAGVAVLLAGAVGLVVYGAHFSSTRFSQAAVQRWQSTRGRSTEDGGSEV